MSTALVLTLRVRLMTVWQAVSFKNVYLTTSLNLLPGLNWGILQAGM